MLLKRALFVSSRDEAETFEYKDTSSVGFIRNMHPCYRFSVVQLSERQEETARYRFAIQRVTFPHAQEGKGWGEPAYGEHYHTREDLFENLRSYLAAYGLNTDQWEPVEQKEA